MTSQTCFLPLCRIIKLYTCAKFHDHRSNNNKVMMGGLSCPPPPPPPHTHTHTHTHMTDGSKKAQVEDQTLVLRTFSRSMYRLVVTVQSQPKRSELKRELKDCLCIINYNFKSDNHHRKFTLYFLVIVYFAYQSHTR